MNTTTTTRIDAREWRYGIVKSRAGHSRVWVQCRGPHGWMRCGQGDRRNDLSVKSELMNVKATIGIIAFLRWAMDSHREGQG